MQAYRRPLLTNADRANASVQFRPHIPGISTELRLQIAGYLNLSDFLNLRSISKNWKDDLQSMANMRLLIARSLDPMRTRAALQRAMPTVAPFLRAEIESRLAILDDAELRAQRACCTNRLFMVIGIAGLCGGGFLIAAGEHRHILRSVTAGIVIMALGLAACLLSICCGLLAERHGRVLDRGGVPRPRSPDVSYGSDFYGMM